MSKIYLRALTLSDIDKTLIWNNQSDISEMYSGHPFPVNIELEKKWYDKVLTSNFPTSVFGIEHIQDGNLIGLSMLKDINLINRSAEFAIFIGDNKYKGQGLSKEATFLTLKFGFHKLGLNRVFLKVLEKNEKAINLYKKSGFFEEGRLRRSIFKNNCFHNEIIMSILSDEFNG